MAREIDARPVDGNAFYTIGETARLAGVNQAAVRLWEREGLIQPQRTRGGHRLYSMQDVERLRQIAWLRRVERLNAAAIRRELGPPDGPASETESSLGRRVHALRKRRGLSLRDLAAQTRLSASLISAVERGHSGISLQNLVKLADELGTTVPELQARHQRRPRRLVRPPDRPKYVADDRMVIIEELITEPSSIVVQLIQVAPGRAMKNTHTHPGEDFVHLLSGQLSFWIDESEYYHLEPGDSLHLANGQAHRWRNDADSPAVLLRIALPPVESTADGWGDRHRASPSRSIIAESPAGQLRPYVDDWL